MRKISNKEKIIYQNQNGKIIAIENMMFGGTRYILLNADGNYVQDLIVPFANLNPQIGDKVQCLLKSDSWNRMEFGKIYKVCELVKNDPGTIYVDVGDGWQRKLVRGEYQMA